MASLITGGGAGNGVGLRRGDSSRWLRLAVRRGGEESRLSHASPTAWRYGGWAPMAPYRMPSGTRARWAGNGSRLRRLAVRRWMEESPQSRAYPPAWRYFGWAPMAP